MKIEYKSIELRDSSLAIIKRANTIIDEYLEKGFKLTLRQLYYQFVSRGWIANKQKEYKRLGSIVNDGRLAGLIDWDAIEDRGRNVRTHLTFRDPAHRIKSAANNYQIDLWADQPTRVEVWIEKEALAGVIEPVCDEFRVPSFACKGYTSQSEMWDSGRNRIGDYIKDGQTPIIIHLGDHDPSGIDMTRDIRERIEVFAEGEVEIERIALNMDQVEQYNPPPNPAKPTDARFDQYQRKFGDECWELDALNPETLSDLIRAAIMRRLDAGKFNKLLKREKNERSGLERISKHYEAIDKYARSLNGKAKP